jgi:hypothetical protein
MSHASERLKTLERQCAAKQGASMKRFEEQGAAIRASARALVLEFLDSHTDAKPGRAGVRQATIFRSCGFDWGDREKATSSHQQYWTVAILKQLEKEGLIVQVRESGPWRKAG